jgi:hypothetical protein
MPEGAWPLIPDVANLTLFINEQLKGDEKYSILLKELGKAEKNIENIEDILSFLRSLLLVSKGGDVRGLSESDLLDLDRKICAQIVIKLDVHLPDQETPYHRLARLIEKLQLRYLQQIMTY